MYNVGDNVEIKQKSYHTFVWHGRKLKSLIQIPLSVKLQLFQKDFNGRVLLNSNEYEKGLWPKYWTQVLI